MEEIEDKGGEEKGYSREEVEQMINDALEKQKGGDDQTQVLSKLVTLLEDKDKGKEHVFEGDRGYVAQEDIDEDDRMEMPEVFFTHQFGYHIVDDKRNGHPVRTPYGNEIVFKPIATKMRQNGPDMDHVHISTYATYSKREAEWLKEHSLYGIKFFSRMDEAEKNTIQRSTLVARFYMQYQGMSASQLIQQCKNYNLTPGETAVEMRQMLAEVKADEALREKGKRSKEILEGAQKDHEAINS